MLTNPFLLHPQTTTGHRVSADAPAMPSPFTGLWSWLSRRRVAATVDAAGARNAARDAEAVREVAARHALTDPSYAADLYAAAARHEALYEEALQKSHA